MTQVMEVVESEELFGVLVHYVDSFMCSSAKGYPRAIFSALFEQQLIGRLYLRYDVTPT